MCHVAVMSTSGRGVGENFFKAKHLLRIVIFCFIRGLLEKYSTLFFSRAPHGFETCALALVDLEASCACVFSPLPIASAAGTQHVSEVVRSAFFGFSLQGKSRSDWSSASASNFARN